MLPLSIFAMMLWISIAFCIRSKCFSNDILWTNRTEAGIDKFKCVGWEKTIKHLKIKERLWVNNMKDHFSHTDFYMDILKREQEVLLNVTADLKFIDKKDYLGNPISLFALLKRSAQDWPKVAILMHSLPGINPVSYNSSFAILHREYKFHLPNIEDLSTGYRGLTRLQSVYNITLEAMARQNVTSMENIFSASDFLGFAKFDCITAWGEKCQEWIEKVQKGNFHTRYMDISEEILLELSFICNCKNGNNQTEIDIIFQDLLERKSTMTTFSSFSPIVLDEIFIFGCKLIKEEVNNWREQHMKILNQQNSESEEKRFIAWTNIQDNDASLMDLCQYPAVYNVTARLLRCRYVHYNKPQLRIGPFKMEEFHIDPPVLMFHDVISDKEISEMVNYGWNIMYKATVHYSKDGSGDVNVNFRTSEQGWIDDHLIPVARTLSQRVRLMTGWDLRKSDPNQIACYGPGGEFIPHVDALDEESFALTPDYTDYSVLMFYINDVIAGGHTIFPALNVSLVPQKGSAAVWFNRKPDGSPDEQSIHGGCPVLEGYKWVINKWVHVNAPQDFPKCTKKKNSSFRYFYL